LCLRVDPVHLLESTDTPLTVQIRVFVLLPDSPHDAEQGPNSVQSSHRAEKKF
jgi:hypothetical protein